jgi:sulfonate transport system substrate-binding protein
MINQIFGRLIPKWISLIKFRNIPFNNQHKLFFSSPLPVVGAFVTGLCLSLLFAACSSTPTVNAPNPNATSQGNSTSSNKEINVKDAMLTKEEYAAFSPKT